MANLIRLPPVVVTEPERACQSLVEGSVVEPDLDDLVHAWRRLGEPSLRHMAIRLIRTLGQEVCQERNGVAVR